MRLNVTVTKTSRGDQDYIQVMSDDMTTVNVVLVADSIEVQDHRKTDKMKDKKRGGRNA